MKKIAPEIVRQRLLIEGFYTKEVQKQEVIDYLLGLAKHLNLRVYGDPIVFSPSSGMGKEINSGYDAFVPLIDSGISLYVWTGPKFMSVVIYTCKAFDEKEAVAFTQGYFTIKGETATHAF